MVRELAFLVIRNMKQPDMSSVLPLQCVCVVRVQGSYVGAGSLER